MGEFLKPHVLGVLLHFRLDVVPAVPVGLGTGEPRAQLGLFDHVLPGLFGIEERFDLGPARWGNGGVGFLFDGPPRPASRQEKRGCEAESRYCDTHRGRVSVTFFPFSADSTVMLGRLETMSGLSHILKYPRPPRPKEEGMAIL